MPPVRSLLVGTGTGAGSMAIAPFLGPTVNLAALTGATAGPAAGADVTQRWQVGVSSGVTLLVLGALAPVTSAGPFGAAPLGLLAGGVLLLVLR